MDKPVLVSTTRHLIKSSLLFTSRDLQEVLYTLAFVKEGMPQVDDAYDRVQRAKVYLDSLAMTLELLDNPG